jgi:hypothetical protein
LLSCMSRIGIFGMLPSSRLGHSGLNARELDHLDPLLGFYGDASPESVGEPASTAPPTSASRTFNLGSARLALTSLLSLSMISAGVFLDTPRPSHALDSIRHEIADGRHVGQRLQTCFRRHRQRGQLAGPNVLDRPGRLPKNTCTCPAIRSVSARGAPR